MASCLVILSLTINLSVIFAFSFDSFFLCIYVCDIGFESLPFDTGDKVRILEEKEKFDKKKSSGNHYIQLMKGKDTN